MTLNLLYIKYFCDAVKLGSVTAAAKSNFVTQSAISQGIGKLEKALGISLLARHPNRFRLTPEGTVAFQEMSEILQRTTEFHHNFSKGNAQALGDLEFACTHSFALSVIPQMLKRFRAEYPEVKINFCCTANPDDINHMLKSGKIDFGILPQIDIGALSGCHQRTIYTGKYGLYTACKVKPKDERKLGFILPCPEDATYFKEAYFLKNCKAPDVFLEVGSWEVVANLAAEGLGIGYCPDYVAMRKTAFLRPSKLALDLPRYQICALHPAGMKLRKSSERFLSYFN